MAQAKQGDTVQVHYTGRLETGVVFDSSLNRSPLTFTLGSGQVIAGFEQGVLGMAAGETKTITVPIEQAYGPRRDDRIFTMERSKLPYNFEATVGQRLELTQSDDQSLLVTVLEANENELKLDANHPLAGKPLTFQLQLVGIVGAA